MTTAPNSGSNEARKQGCLCSVVDNEFGKGYLGCGDRYGFVINENCPLHAPTGKEKTNIFLDQFKRAIKRFKHNQEEVGTMLGISRSSVSRILQGKQSNLAIKLMKEIRLYTRYGRIDELITQEDLKQHEETMKKPIHTQDAVEFTTVEYIKQDWKGQIRNIGCLTAILVQAHDHPECPYMVAIGVSLCNLEYDKFNKEIAKEIALERARSHYETYKLKNKCLYYNSNGRSGYLSDATNKFILRCMRYYKNKSIILPKIIFV